MNSKNTKPELKVQSILKNKKLFFVKHIKALAGTPDIVIPSHKIIIDIKGCFWHQHGCNNSKFPKTNQLFWVEKFEKIKIKDTENLKFNKKKGWNTFDIWECIIDDHHRLYNEINRILEIGKLINQNSSLNRYNSKQFKIKTF